MPESNPGISNWRRSADICGFLSLLCGLLLLTLFLAGGRLHFPDWMAPAIIWTIFAAPLVGALLALLASIGRRWWLVPLAAWLAMLTFEWWSLAHHPFDL
jgi:hypothetical protein